VFQFLVFLTAILSRLSFSGGGSRRRRLFVTEVDFIATKAAFSLTISQIPAPWRWWQ